MYDYLLNQWVLRKVAAAYLQAQVVKGRITQAQYETIIATPQITI